MEAAFRPDGDRPQFIQLMNASRQSTEMRPHELTYALLNPVIGSDKDALGPSALQTDAEGYLSVHLNIHTDRLIAEKTIHWNHNEELAHPASLKKKEHYPEFQNNALCKVFALSQGARDQYITKIIQECSKSKYYLLFLSKVKQKDGL